MQMMKVMLDVRRIAKSPEEMVSRKVDQLKLWQEVLESYILFGYLFQQRFEKILKLKSQYCVYF